MDNNTDSLKELSVLCQQLRDAENEAESLSTKLTAAKADVRRLCEEDIPEFMSELGLKEVTLNSGEKITVASDIFLQTLVENKERVHQWLEDNGFGSIVKTIVSVMFGTQELDKAIALATKLTEDEKLTPEIIRGVHAGTMKAWLKEKLIKETEQTVNGEEITAPVPLELFGARPVTIAKIKLPKVNAS